MKKNKLEYIDVDNLNDFPVEPAGHRYVYFYGGTKNYRGYIAPNNMSRGDFMEIYPEYIPEQNILCIKMMEQLYELIQNFLVLAFI